MSLLLGLLTGHALAGGWSGEQNQDPPPDPDPMADEAPAPGAPTTADPLDADPVQVALPVSAWGGTMVEETATAPLAGPTTPVSRPPPPSASPPAASPESEVAAVVAPPTPSPLPVPAPVAVEYPVVPREPSGGPVEPVPLLAQDLAVPVPVAAPARPGAQELRQQLDYTASLLAPGEVRVGPLSLGVGVLPRLQLGTVPATYSLDMPNADLQIGLLRRPDLGFSAGINRYSIAWGDFTGSFGTVRGVVSWWGWAPVSLHARVGWTTFTASGPPDLDRLPMELMGFSPEDVDTLQGVLDDFETRTILDASWVKAGLAADHGFNARDSVVGQVAFSRRRRLDAMASLDGDPIDLDYTMIEPLIGGDSTWTLSAAYQARFRHFELRLGVGYSSVPGAWLLQSTQLAWRFGGPERRRARQQRQAARQEAQKPEA